MPSPVGHSLAGVCGFMVAQNHVPFDRRRWLFFAALLIALLPDIDVLPGLLLGDPRSFHHQATHSIAVTMMVGLLVGGVARWWKLNGIGWGIWGAGVYLGHIVLDLLVDDQIPPFGVQLLWPFSHAYFISPITPFTGFDYFDPERGVISTLLTFHNIWAIFWEVALLAPLVLLVWCLRESRKQVLAGTTNS